ncbi:GGDEF domain-containing protein [Sphingomonas sp. UYP23]
MTVRRAQEGAGQGSSNGDPFGDIGASVLAFLAEQPLGPTPGNYELGYLYRTDRDSLAARSIDAVLASGATLTQAQADYILSACHAPPRQSGDACDGAAETPTGARLRHQTLQLHDLASDAATVTGQFGRDLSAELIHIEADSLPIARTITTMIARSGDAERNLVAALEQIDALHAEVAAAQNDALRDSLTGLVNRRGFAAELAKGASDAPVALAICDIDRFKAINDRHGHPVGDRVIKAVAESIARCCAPHVVSRWGGEEFLILMDDVTLAEAHEIVATANHALQNRAFRIRESGEALDPITFSAGIVLTQRASALDSIAAADLLLYRAKEAGRNSVYSQDSTQRAA